MTTTGLTMINEKLDLLVPNPVCELNYTKDYELLMAVMLSAQSTDKRVNEVTKTLFKYSLEELASMDLEKIESIIKSVGTYHRKALYLKEIAFKLLNECNGLVPRNREYIESLPGIGHKTCNVFLSEFYDEPAIAVDTHILRVCKRLGITKKEDDVIITENKLMKIIPRDKWSRTHLQLVLFGRYTCKALKPECNKCLFQDICTVYNSR